MNRKQELIDYLNRKYEAHDFWCSLRHVVKIEEKIKLLEREIKEAHDELVEIRKLEAQRRKGAA